VQYRVLKALWGWRRVPIERGAAWWRGPRAARHHRRRPDQGRPRM
jgi:hypothetical protein